MPPDKYTAPCNLIKLYKPQLSSYAEKLQMWYETHTKLKLKKFYKWHTCCWHHSTRNVCLGMGTLAQPLEKVHPLFSNIMLLLAWFVPASTVNIISVKYLLLLIWRKGTVVETPTKCTECLAEKISQYSRIASPAT